MKDFWITPDRLFDGEDLRTGVSVRIEDGRLVEISDTRPNAPSVSGCLSPGFVDLQVNGGGGVQLNATPTADAMEKIAAAHRSFGTVAILPTVITDHPNVLERAADAAIMAKGRSGIAGLHIEGPHICVERRGTHSADFVRPMDAQTINIVVKLRAAGVTVMITLAPEQADLDQITALAATGALVSLGHTDATADRVEAAIAAGAVCGTHLFNAMSPMTSRAPGAVGGILNAGIRFGIICDGYHVDDRMVRLALRACTRRDVAFVVSDAMATVGGPDQFELYGQPVHLEGGRLLNAEGNLAGAHITQAEGVRRLVENIEIPLSDALRMAISTPANLIGRPDLATLLNRSTADVVLLDDALCVKGTIDDLFHDRGSIDAAE